MPVFGQVDYNVSVIRIQVFTLLRFKVLSLSDISRKIKTYLEMISNPLTRIVKGFITMIIEDIYP
jgi:hypothetical protein